MGGHTVRVLVVDDHAAVRQWSAMVLALEPDLTVVGQARDGAEAVQAAMELAPDVVLMDLQMPRSSGLDACRRIRRLVPSARVLVMTGSEEEEERAASLRAGAAGYLLKSGDMEQLIGAVRAVSCRKV